MRITWVDGATNVDVDFYPKGAGKAQVSVQHTNLATAGEAERMMRYWEENLARLKERVGG